MVVQTLYIHCTYTMRKQSVVETGMYVHVKKNWKSHEFDSIQTIPCWWDCEMLARHNYYGQHDKTKWFISGEITFCRSAIACLSFLARWYLSNLTISCFLSSRRRMIWATSGSWYISNAKSSSGEIDSCL